jgi:uncharacterized protein YkwD
MGADWKGAVMMSGKAKSLMGAILCLIVILGGAANGTGASKQEIIEKWETLKPKYGEAIFVREPSVVAPYAPGELFEEFIQDGINSLNFVRFLAGLPDDVEIKASLSETAQYGAVLMAAAGYLSHRPSKPKDMPQDFYNKGLANTKSSNIIKGRQAPLAWSVFSYMNDQGRKNVTRVGHRRWILNPALKYASFGVAITKGGGDIAYGTLPIHDESRKNLKLPEMILWPGSGDWPSGYMRNNTPFSAQLNRSHYLTPKLDEVKVTVTRVADGRVWELSKDDNVKPPTLPKRKYFNIDTRYIGNEKFHTAIIFRPDDIKKYDGEYQISISGIRTVGGAKTTLEYRVNFFELEMDF